MIDGDLARRAWATYVDLAWGLIPAVRSHQVGILDESDEWNLVATKLTADDFGEATAALRAAWDQAEAALREDGAHAHASALTTLNWLADQLCAIAGARPLH